MDTGPQKESDTPQEAEWVQDKEREREREEEKEQKEKTFQGRARVTGWKWEQNRQEEVCLSNNLVIVKFCVLSQVEEM